MSKYTIADAKTIIPQDLTPNQVQGVEAYLNDGIIPPADPCGSCDPNFIRKLISTIQVAERNGLWPPAREEVKTKPKPRAKAKPKTPEPTEPSGELSEGGYVAGIISKEELEEIQEKRGILLGGIDDPNVDFSEVFKDK